MVEERDQNASGMNIDHLYFWLNYSLTAFQLLTVHLTGYVTHAYDIAWFILLWPRLAMAWLAMATLGYGLATYGLSDLC